MDKTKRIIAGILVAVLLLNTGINGSFATDVDETSGTETETIVEDNETSGTATTQVETNVEDTESETSDAESITTEPETEADTETETEAASYPWEDLDDEAFCAWMNNSDNAVHIIDVLTDSGEEYIALMERVDEIEDWEIMADVYGALEELSGMGQENLQTLDEENDNPVSNAMCEDIFGVTYAQFQADCSLEDNTKSYAEVYVGEAAGYEQTGTQGTAEKPYNSILAVYQNFATRKGVIIHLLASYQNVSDPIDTWPTTALPAVIVSEARESAVLDMHSEEWSFAANTGFYHVNIKLNYANLTTARIFANGHTVVFGGQGENNFGFTRTGNQYYPTLFGAGAYSLGTSTSHDTSISSTNVKVYGGTWSQIFGGGEYYSDVTGEAKVTIDGTVAADTIAYAVTFDNTKLSYMEGSSNIYGGGAGVSNQLLYEAYYAHTGSTVVSLKHIVLNKSVTPNGGFVDTSATLNMDDCVVNASVHVYSEGQSAANVTLNISNSTVKNYVGALGGTYGGATQKYLLKRSGGLTTFTLSLSKSTVKGYVYVRLGKLANEASNDIQNAIVGLYDCIINSFTLTGAGGQTVPTDNRNTMNELVLDRTTIKNMSSMYGFYGYGTLKIIGMGTKTSPFVISRQTFGSYAVSNIFQNVEVEDSYVYMNNYYQIGNLTLKKSTWKQGKNTVLTLNGDYSGTNSIICFYDEALWNIYGNIGEGATELDFSNMNTENARAGVMWYRDSTVGNESFFTLPVSTDPITTTHKTGYQFEYWYGYYGYVPKVIPIYLDGEYGDDANDGTEIDKAVKTFDEAVKKSLATGAEEHQIIVCGKYYITSSTAYEAAYLVSENAGTDNTITVTSKDEFLDYRYDYAGIYIVADSVLTKTTYEYMNLGSSFNFEKINFYNATAYNQIRIFCNGYKTIMGTGVTCTSTSGHFYLSSGSAGNTTRYPDLMVNSGSWSEIDVGGISNNSTCGNPNNTDAAANKNNADRTARLTVTVQTIIGFNGTVYGNVENNFQVLSGNIPKYLYSDSTKSVTVYGDFISNIDYSNVAGFAYTCPAGATIKGDVIFQATNEAAVYDLLVMPNCTVEGKAEMTVYGSSFNISAANYYGLTLVSKDTVVYGGITWNSYVKNNSRIQINGKNTWLKNGGSLRLNLYNTGKIESIYAADSLSASHATSNPYADCENVSLYIKDLSSSNIKELTGFGTVIADNSSFELFADIELKELTVESDAYVKADEKVTIGNETTQSGSLNLYSGGELEIFSNLVVYGSAHGNSAESTEALGLLVNNNGDEDGTVAQIEIYGTSDGQIYYYTSYETASIHVVDSTVPSAYQALPPDENNYTYTTITYDKGEGESTDRTWVVSNLKSRKYVYVDGTLDATSTTYAGHDGTTAALAYATIEEAYDVVLRGGYIIICGDTTVSAWPSNATKKVTVTSKVAKTDGTGEDYYTVKNAAKLILNGTLSMRNDTVFDNLNIQSDSEGYIIKGSGYHLTMGHGHTGSAPSVTMTNKSIQIWGNNGSVNKNSTPHVTIYDGTYNMVTVYAYGYTDSTTSQNGTLEIYGGTFAKIFCYSGIYDNIPDSSVTSITIENATITKGIYGAYRPEYPRGTYNITLGNGVTFGATAGIYLATEDYHTFSAKTVTYNLTVSNTDKAYTIPYIYCGSYYRDISSNGYIYKITMDLQNVNVTNLYCGPSVDISFSSKNSFVKVNLHDNTQVDTLYYGGVTDKCLPDVEVTIDSDTADVTNLHTTSTNVNVAPETAKLIFKGVGTSESPYEIPSTWDIRLLTSLELDNAVVDFTNVKEMNTDQLTLKNASTFVSHYAYPSLTGNYESVGTGNKFSLPNAALMAIDGTVTGTTDVLYNGKETESFPNGVRINAEHSDAHTADQFTYFDKEAEQKQSMELTVSDEQDTWSVADPEYSEYSLYVSPTQGNDKNPGTRVSPLKTIGQAYNMAEQKYTDSMQGGETDGTALPEFTICLLDDGVTLEEDSGWSLAYGKQGCYTVTITSDGEESYKLILKNEFVFPMQTTVDRVTLSSSFSTASPELYADGYEVTFTSNVSAEAVSRFYPVVYGGNNSISGESLTTTNLTVSGGTWNRIFGGSKYCSVEMVSLKVGGSADTTEASIGTNEENNTGVFGGGFQGEVTGKVSLTVAGGKFFRVYGGGYSAKVGSVGLDFQYGTIDYLYGGGCLAQAACEGDICVNIGMVDAADDSEKASIQKAFRGSGLYAGLASGKVTYTYIYQNTYVAESTQFATGGYSGTVDKTILSIRGGIINTDVFGGGWGEGTPGAYGNVTDSTTIRIEGGTITGSIYGGGNLGNVGSEAKNGSCKVTLTGGSVLKESTYNGETITGQGNVYGGGYAAPVYGTVTVTLGDKDNGELSATIGNSVFGGGQGNDTYAADIAGTGKVTVNIYHAAVGTGIYGGCDTNGTVKTTDVKVYAIPGESCNIFGAGYGGNTVVGTTNVTLELNKSLTELKQLTNNGSVYGGGEQGQVTGSTNVTVNSWKGNVYGGGKGVAQASGVVRSAVYTVRRAFARAVSSLKAAVAAVVDMVTGDDTADVDDDSDDSGTSDDPGVSYDLEKLTDANAGATKVTVSGTIHGNIYGGGELATVGSSDNTTWKKDVTTVTVNDGAVVDGNIYGGGRGQDGEDYAVIYGNTSVTINGGMIRASEITGADGQPISDSEDAGNGAVFGGGEIAPVAGDTNVTVMGGIISNVFGGNDTSGEIAGNTKVAINGSPVVAHVYGGGRDAAYSGTGTVVTISGGAVTEAYAGGKGAGAEVAKASVTISSGTVTTAYAGGKQAKTTNTSISVKGGQVGTVYAGGNAATVTGSTTLTVDTAGADTGSSIQQYVETVFAGNNQAPMDIQPKLKLTSGKIGTVYCGGNAGIMTASAVTDADGKTANGLTYVFDYPEIVVDTVFAGCNNTTDDTADVTLTMVSGTYGEVYGGNNANGDLQTATDIIIDDESAKNCTDTNGHKSHGLSVDSVYGGGNIATSKKTQVTLIHYTMPESSDSGDADASGESSSGSGSGESAGTTDSSQFSGQLTIYGGGNQAYVADANITLKIKGGWANTVYGGGNAATVGSTTISAGIDGSATTGDKLRIEKLFCGNNAAEMNIQSKVSLGDVSIGEFYGGGNAGRMMTTGLTNTTDESLNGSLFYELGNPSTEITTLYGGCNQADVEGRVTLKIAGANVETVYGGCNTSGTMTESVVYIRDDVGTVYGGGCGVDTTTTTTNVFIQNGIVSGNVYGGSGLGYVGTASVTVEEAADISEARIVIQKNVFGAGYGESSVARETHVTVNMALNIGLGTNAGECDLQITAEPVQTTSEYSASSGETAAVGKWQSGKENKVSVINGNVYGGGDMGKVGDGTINTSSNTANTVNVNGTTEVQIQNGYIAGSVFGGGNGVPTDTSYTVYMGTVFGSSRTEVTGGYISGSIYGCGNQSRTYATDGTAAELTIQETAGSPIVIGTSIFGGGNKGEGNTVNASVYTVVGSTTVNIFGLESADEPTAIYMLSEKKGGVYGDGNLCLVNGTRTVNITNFNRGKNNLNEQLKTFYSLQRADVVNLTNTRIVLEGAEDLVDSNAGTTLYSINRVGQLNMNKNSAIKLTEIVNLLGGLSSDCNTSTTYIDRGNNGKNNYTTRGGNLTEEVITSAREELYQAAYETFLNSKGETTSNLDKVDNTSFNVVCVANGKYLEVKQSDTQYGNVTGLFILQLLHAEAGVGGGFVYANIGRGSASDETGTGDGSSVGGVDGGNTENGLDKGSTGDFVCVTRQEARSDEEGTVAAYMKVVDNVGGYDGSDYTYYYWYIKGGNMNYKVYLNGYIGTSETSFEESVILPTIELDRGVTTKTTYYVLRSVEGGKDNDGNDIVPTTELNVGNSFNTTRLVDSWDDEDETLTTGDHYAIEVMASAVLNKDNTKYVEVQSIGYLVWDNENGWRIYGTARTAGKKDDGTADDSADTYFKGTGDDQKVGTAGGDADGTTENEKNTIKANTIYTVPTGTQIESLSLKLVLHKGTGVDVEIKNVLNTITLDIKDDNLEAVSGEDTSELVIKNYTSITRIVPTQAAYMSSGRQYAGVASDSQVNITKKSAFTVQYITRYVPSAFTGGVTEKLTLDVNEMYLWSEETGVGFTVVEAAEKPGNSAVAVNEENSGTGSSGSPEDVSAGTTGKSWLIAVTDGSLKEYTGRIKKSGSGYVLLDADGSGKQEVLKCSETNHTQTYFPKGTTITLVAQIDDNAPTYWYYYCTDDTGTEEIMLNSFVQMNTAYDGAGEADRYSLEKASGNQVSASTSNRITENLIFVVDFANISLGDAGAEDGEADDEDAVDQKLEGRLQLKHSYQTGSDYRDIMDYVTEEGNTEEGTASAKYKRTFPAISNSFKVDPYEDGIHKFELNVVSSSGAGTDSASGSPGDGASGTNAVCYPKDTLTAEIAITPDSDVMNTQYDEREYSVVLTLLEGTGGSKKSIAFPEGTVFLFQGERLQTNTENKSVIVPVKKAGTYTLKIETALSGYALGSYTLNAELYSSSAANYHNSLETSKTKTTTFTVVEFPTYALSVTANGDGASQIVSVGGNLDIIVKASTSADGGSGSTTGAASGETSGTSTTSGVQKVAVKLYQYQKNNTGNTTAETGTADGTDTTAGTSTANATEKTAGKYVWVGIDTIFISDVDTVSASPEGVAWKPVISDDATPGTYRLEFTYGDKTEYLDFIVQ